MEQLIDVRSQEVFLIELDSIPPWERIQFQLPTYAPAGSEEKIEVLAARYDAGYPLWLEDDGPDLT